MKEYTVQKDNHDFKPNDQRFFSWKSKVKVRFSLTQSMWFSREDPDYQGGNDVFDWNKIAGVTGFFSSNSTNALMFAWRPAEELEGTFEIAGYVNDKDGAHSGETILFATVGTEYEGEAVWSGDYAVFKLREVGEDEFSFVSMPLNRLPWYKRFYREIGPWFGGNQKAHKEMKLNLEIK